MRFKIALDIERISLSDIVSKTASTVHLLLGKNNKWHDLERKPFTCSLIKGGKLINKVIVFNDPHIIINTEDNEVIDEIVTNSMNFSIEPIKVYTDFNILSVKNTVYNSNGKKNWITEANKDKFIELINNRYAIDAEILKIRNSSLAYKKSKKIPVSDLLIKITGDKNVKNLFESGIGGSCSLGFGFVESLNSNK